MAATCGKCGSECFLFMGGCYRTGSQPGSEICTAAEGGKCTVCKTDNGLFKNPAAPQRPGSECILCWDTEGDGATKGVKDCATCTAPQSAAAATCKTCKAGFSGTSSCTPCTGDCTTCTESSPTECTSCKDGKYLKRSQCVAKGECTTDHYPDDTGMECVACSTIDSCTQCTFDLTTKKPKCTNCGISKKVKTELDGTTTCVDIATGCEDENHFKDGDTACLLCGDVKGVPNCETCSGAKACTKCLPGFFRVSETSCTACGDNCATCSEAGNANRCLTCKSGFFLITENESKKCVPCDSKTDDGIDGCAECDNSKGSLKCTKCKPNRKPAGKEGDYTCTVKNCEDDTLCGGTAGACNAIILDAQGKEFHYCSFCGESSKFPIDGVCASNGDKAGNTCADGVCTQCTTGYFLYMGGCYKAAGPPGSLVCKAAGDGVCTEAAAGYFVPPSPTKDKQSALSCSNPLGVELADQKAYAGVEGCSRCTAPAQLEASGMAAATCTACGEGRKPNKSGTGCAACSDANCKHCRVDGVCEECSSGFSLEGGKCVSTGGPNLSTGAIAGISVAAIVVVGGLVGFLCWWFICRGKA
ncbi:VSP [Giardia lamblia P15]|uniref:VSP n=1 Tax=Giardia intestinalis (strain P15) TaxID=658858 RepID=E1F9E4_GIAIA|nr:VSP [Giardia lamblia P15]